MGLLGCETTLKMINHDASPPLEATKGFRGPLHRPDRMTQSAINNNNTCCSGRHAAPCIPQTRGGLIASAL